MAIAIIGNVGNSGFALPMVQAYPTDPNLAQLLAWSPTAQALDYVPYTGNAFGDFGVTRDLAVGRDLSVAGIATFTQKPVFTAGLPALSVVDAVTPANGTITASGLVQGFSVKAVNGANNAELQATKLQIQATDVVGTRKTGWTAMTGTPQKTTAATGTVTLPQLAGIVMALQADLISHGLIGA